ncbi:hypothetical protein ABZ639_22075 [Saccharomonospora sp. NPDC006951]
MEETALFTKRISFRRDCESIIDDVLWSPDLNDVFEERGWPSSVRGDLRENLLRDEDFLRRMRTVHASVEQRATRLDEHSNEKPVVEEEDVLAVLRMPRVRTLGVTLGAILIAAVGIPLVLLPWPFWLQLPISFVVGYALYRLPWVDQTVAKALPSSIWQRREWGRRRLRLRAGVTRLRWDWKTTVRNEVVLPEIVARINQGGHRRFSHDLRISRPLLVGGAPSSTLISTTAVRRLGRELSQTTTGAIALSGRRGVGKTTLLQALAQGVLPEVNVDERLTVVVPAPARYELREFVLHLHATVCRAVLEVLGNPRMAQGVAVPDRWLHHQRRADRRAIAWRAARYFVKATAWLVFAVGLASMLWRQHDLARLPGRYIAEGRQLVASMPSQATSGELPAVGLDWLLITLPLVFGAWWLARLVTLPLRRLALRVVRWSRERFRAWIHWWQQSFARDQLVSVLAKAGPLLPRRLRPKLLPGAARKESTRVTLTGIERGRRLHQLSQSMRVLAALATEQLRRIRFLQTSTSGWSGKVDGPRSFGLTVTRSVAHAEQPLTQPEVVDQLRGFLQHAATTLIRAGTVNGIVIAIDELDKFAEPTQAHEFVNEIKTVFGVDNCAFLVSVSDDALASFELRGIPVRDALDSAFTAMITVDPFTLAEAEDWLDHRLVGLPSPYACLCYVLSAGVPRELERVVATLLDLEWESSRRDARPGIEYQPSLCLKLADVTKSIVAADVAAKLRAFTFTVRNRPPGELASEIIVVLNTVGGLARPCEHNLVARLDELAEAMRKKGVRGEDAELTRICHETAGFCNLTAAILEIFDDDLDEETLKVLSAETLTTLADARRALAVEPLLTWSMVTSVRERRAQLRAGTT